MDKHETKHDNMISAWIDASDYDKYDAHLMVCNNGFQASGASMKTKEAALCAYESLRKWVAEITGERQFTQGQAREMYEELEYEQVYWYIGTSGCVCKENWIGASSDRDRLAQGSVFLSKESAEQQARYSQLWQDCRKAMRDAWEKIEVDSDDNLKEKHRTYLKNYVANQIPREMKIYSIVFPCPLSLTVWRKTVTDDDIRLMLMGVQ